MFFKIIHDQKPRKSVFIDELATVKDYMQVKDWRGALDVLNMIKMKYPRESYILPTHYYGMKADVFIAMKEYEKAMNMCLLAIKENQANLFIYNKLVFLEIASDDPVKIGRAMVRLDSLLAGEINGIKPDGYSYLNAIRACCGLGRYADARRYVNAVESCYPDMQGKLPIWHTILADKILLTKYPHGLTLTDFFNYNKLAGYQRNTFFDIVELLPDWAIKSQNRIPHRLQ